MAVLDDLNDLIGDNGGGGTDPVYHEQVAGQTDVPANAVIYQSAIIDAEALYIGFICPGGLYKIDKDTGEILQHSVTYTVFYRVVGATDWVHAFTKKITARTRQPIRWEETIAENLSAAQYEVAVVNRNTPLDEFDGMQEIRIDYHKERRYMKFNLRNTAFYEVTLEANDQLNGRIPNMSVLVQGRKVRVYTDASTYTVEWSNNPAWVILDLLTNERYGLGIPDNRIDIDAFLSAAAWFDANNITLNLVLDGTKNARDIITAIQTATMCFVVQSGDKIRIVPDTIADPVQAFTEDNIVDGSLSWEKASLLDKINRIIIDYLEELDDYKKATIVIDAPNITKVREKKIALLGVTNYEQAEKIGKLLLNYSELAQTVVRFKTGAMGLAAEVGDIITISYDPADWVDKQFRVIETRLNDDLTVEIVGLEYSPDIYDLSGFHTWTPSTEETVTEAPNITGLSATTQEYVGVDGVSRQKIVLSWTNPVDQTNWNGVQIYEWREDTKYFELVGRTKENGFEILNAKEGLIHKIAITSVNKNGIVNAIQSSPQVEIFVDYLTPPDIQFDLDKCVWDGYQLIVGIIPPSNFAGEYEIRTSNPADWAADNTGLLGRNYSPIQVYPYQDPGSDQITIYAKAYYRGKYSLNAATITIPKTIQDENYVSLPDYLATYSENLLRNAGFLNTFINDEGYIDFMYWDGYRPGTNYLVYNVPEDNQLFGGYALIKAKTGKNFSQTVTIRPVPVGSSRNYTISWWSVWYGSNTNTPGLEIEYLDKDFQVLDSVVLSATWQNGGDNWENFKFHLSAPENTNYIRVWITGIAIYDAIMLSEGTIFPPFHLHDADVVDGIDSALEEEAARNFQLFLESRIQDIEERLRGIENIWDVLNMDASVMKTKAFQIQARAIDLIAGDVDSNNSRLTLLEDRVVLAVNTATGTVAEFTLGTGVYGSDISIKADQINITGSTAFYSSDGKLSTTLIKGGAIMADSIIARVNLSGSCLEVAPDDTPVWHEVYQAYITPKAVFGATLDPLDTDPTRLTIDNLGRIWSGHPSFTYAKFSVDENGYLKATDAKFYGRLYVYPNNNTLWMIFDSSYTGSLADENNGLRIFDDSLGANETFLNHLLIKTTGYIKANDYIQTDNKIRIKDTYPGNVGIAEIYVSLGNLYYRDPSGNVFLLSQGMAASGDTDDA